MKILGLKLTHDGAFALVDDGKLIFSYEMEKLNNFPRYSEFCISIEDVENILSEFGYSFKTIDQVVIDGWSNWDTDITDRYVTRDQPGFTFKWKGKDIEITTCDLAGYGHVVKPTENILQPSVFKQQQFSYKSYMHVTGHVTSAYCSSPFSAKKEDAYILVWDGGMPPQLFYYHYNKRQVVNLGVLFPVIGYVYLNFAHAFKPFSLMPYGLSIAGKAMAYMSMGKVEETILQEYRNIFAAINKSTSDIDTEKEIVVMITHQFIRAAKEYATTNNLRDEDMLTSFQAFMQELLLQHLSRKLQETPGLTTNLCIAGGCGLNIKWNSSIRNSGLFKEVWVPPFPNDSGSAIGMACAEMMTTDGIPSLDWTVYSGPAIKQGKDADGYSSEYASRECDVNELAHILYEYNEPVVFLNESAELGPRALGNRSILATAVSAAMKKKLNDMKHREDYRPVAPICMEEFAPAFFTPGTPDPYMLFEHHVKPSWKDKIPAICHLDGTARLQTINEKENSTVYRLLSRYHRLSGIPLLCNTSANLNGSGFFPDVQSAMKWNKANLIWCNNRLYVKKEFIHFPKLAGKVATV